MFVEAAYRSSLTIVVRLRCRLDCPRYKWDCYHVKHAAEATDEGLLHSHKSFFSGFICSILFCRFGAFWFFICGFLLLWAAEDLCLQTSV